MSHITESYYFGCWRQAGHYFFAPGMVRVGEVTPWGYTLDSRAFDTDEWVVWHAEGWTAIGREDRTVDHRPGSHSIFALHAPLLTVAEAETEAQRLFPEIFERTGWPVTANTDLEPLAREIYGVMKDYSDSLAEVGDDPNFTSYDAEEDEIKGLLNALARWHLRKKK